LVCFVLLGSPYFTYADFSGLVVGVSDGDTITVLHDQTPIKIRLHGIDCPEKRQAFGNKAKQFTSHLVFGKDVTIIEHGFDKYGRILGDVILADGQNLNRKLVKAGLAWWYRKYTPKREDLAGMEREARQAKLGLWLDSDPIPPWCFRKQEKGQAC
jgi:endonuclease YncB( thermonuclease family)